MSQFKLVTSCGIALFSAAISLCAWSLPSDRQQTIEIESNSAEYNEQAGLMVYSGNVIIRQGTMMIEADQVDVVSADNKVERIICTGNPASYRQQMATEGGPVIARAARIDYLLNRSQINLKGDASLNRDGTLIKGDSIEFDLKKETWSARGSNTGPQKRIQLVIPPSRQDNSEEAPAEPPEEPTESIPENSGAQDQ